MSSSRQRLHINWFFQTNACCLCGVWLVVLCIIAHLLWVGYWCALPCCLVLSLSKVFSVFLSRCVQLKPIKQADWNKADPSSREGVRHTEARQHAAPHVSGDLLFFSTIVFPAAWFLSVGFYIGLGSSAHCNVGTVFSPSFVMLSQNLKPLLFIFCWTLTIILFL